MARRLLVGLAALTLAGCGSGTVAADPQVSSAPVARREVDRSLFAKDIELKPATLTAPSGSDILVAFDNADPGVPHGLALYRDPAHTITLGTAPVIVGPDHRTFRVAALAPGRYQFACVVHPMMVADLVIEP